MFIFLFIIFLNLINANSFNIVRPSLSSLNHNLIYHSIYHHDKDTNYFSTANKNKTNHQSLYGSLNGQSNQLLDIKETEQRLYLGQAHIQFTLDLLGNILIREAFELNDRRSNEQNIKSFNFSPLSVQTLLMLMHLASSGHTRNQIESALYLETLFQSNIDVQDNNYTTPTIHKIYSQLISNLLSDKHLTSTESLSLTSKIFYKKNLKINSRFEQLVNYYYQKPLKQIDFSNQRETLYTINNFISKESKGLIKNFISIPPTTTSKLLAANVIYFKSKWKYSFDPQDTENNAIFIQTNGKQDHVSMMVGKFPIAYAQSKQLKCSIIELPYKITRLSMFFILPDNVNGLLNLMRALNATSLTDLIASMRKTNKNGGVNVRLPKFDISTQFNLINVLNSLGIRSLFNANECDLSNMITINGLKERPIQQNNKKTSNPIINQVNPSSNSMLNEQTNQVHVNDFAHKAILQIDEQGSLGAGASATVVERIGTFNGPYFEADHPFIYFLTDKQTGLILFAGIFANPK